MLSMKSDLVKYLYSHVDAVFEWQVTLTPPVATLSVRSSLCVQWYTDRRQKSLDITGKENESNLCCGKLQCITSYSTKLIATRLQNCVLKNNLYAANIYNIFSPPIYSIHGNIQYNKFKNHVAVNAIMHDEINQRSNTWAYAN